MSPAQSGLSSARLVPPRLGSARVGARPQQASQLADGELVNWSYFCRSAERKLMNGARVGGGAASRLAPAKQQPRELEFFIIVSSRAQPATVVVVVVAVITARVRRLVGASREGDKLERQYIWRLARARARRRRARVQSVDGAAKCCMARCNSAARLASSSRGARLMSSRRRLLGATSRMRRRG